MSMWLYQMSQKEWSPNRYRLEIWEGERWRWPVKKASWGGVKPASGDTVVFYYAKSRGVDPGFYGWAFVQEWFDNNKMIYFRPVAPSDYLKMAPWWDERASAVADAVRGKMKQGTLWYVNQDSAEHIRQGVRGWLANA